MPDADPVNPPEEAAATAAPDFAPTPVSEPVSPPPVLGTEEPSGLTQESVLLQTAPSSTPPASPQPETAQMGGNEPFDVAQGKPAEVSRSETTQLPATGPVTQSMPSQAEQSSSSTTSAIPPATAGQTAPSSVKGFLRGIAGTARALLQSRKRKKLDRIMEFLNAKDQRAKAASAQGSGEPMQITNDQVEKLLHVSDATATRYLTQLEREGKIRQVGKAGAGVSYIKV